MHFVVSSSCFHSVCDSGGLTEGLYARDHCWALDGFKLGGLFCLSVIESIIYIYVYIYIYI